MTIDLSKNDHEINTVAKGLAEGMAPETIAALYGITPERIRMIQTSPRFIAAMRGYLEVQFQTELRPVAQKAALDLMRNVNTSEMVRARLALGVLDQARRIELADKQLPGAKSLDQMSQAEIEEHLAQLEAKRAENLKTIDAKSLPATTINPQNQ